MIRGLIVLEGADNYFSLQLQSKCTSQGRRKGYQVGEYEEDLMTTSESMDLNEYIVNERDGMDTDCYINNWGESTLYTQEV